MLYTATVARPSSLQARMTRTAISPLFAMSTLLKPATAPKLLLLLLEHLDTAGSADPNGRLQLTNSPPLLPVKSVRRAAGWADDLDVARAVHAVLVPLWVKPCTEVHIMNYNYAPVGLCWCTSGVQAR